MFDIQRLQFSLKSLQSQILFSYSKHCLTECLSMSIAGEFTEPDPFLVYLMGLNFS